MDDNAGREPAIGGAEEVVYNGDGRLLVWTDAEFQAMPCESRPDNAHRVKGVWILRLPL